jgi:hypothetical protein
MPHPLPHAFPPLRGSRRSSGAECVFADDDGRTWTAVSFPMTAGRATGEEHPPGCAVVFTCATDARLAQRATGAPAGTRLVDVPEPTLRSWLAHAPHLGRLS